MSDPLLVIAAGGTGGHMFPAQALAEEMLARGWRVSLTTDGRGLRYAGGFPDAVERVELRAASTGQGGLATRIGAPMALMRGTWAAMGRFRRDRPAAVAGFGGYPAFPALAAATVMRVPALIHEQNGVLGRVNRLFARRVSRVACGTWPLTNPPRGAALIHTGNPVRAAIRAVSGAPYTPPDEIGNVNLLVFGGSQGASVFARLVPPALAMLPGNLRIRLRVTQQVRPGEENDVAAAYDGAGVRATLKPFFDDMPRLLTEAHLVVARAGASTVAEIAAIGRPSILVPYPAAMDDHQTANARALSDQGGAVLAPEHGLAPAALAALIEGVLTDPDHASALAQRARAAGRPDAVNELAGLVEDIAGRRLPR